MRQRAVHNAVVLEEVAKMAARCERLNPDVKKRLSACRINIICASMVRRLLRTALVLQYISLHRYREDRCDKNNFQVRPVSGQGCWANIFPFYQSVDHVIDGGMFHQTLAEQVWERGFGSDALIPGIAPGSHGAGSGSRPDLRPHPLPFCWKLKDFVKQGFYVFDPVLFFCCMGQKACGSRTAAQG